jgi:mxaJ protein
MAPKHLIHSCSAGLFSLLLASCLLAMSALSYARDTSSTDDRKVLRVCQDPNNLPMSDKDGNGYENKIAALFARKLGWALEHDWYPQRMGFLRNTLQAKIPNTETYKCDVVTGVSSDFERGLATRPYLSSTYAMAYVKHKGLDAIQKPDDLLTLDKAVRDKLKIGIFAGTPAADWLVKNGLTHQMVPYRLQTADPDQYPGQLIEQDLASGKVDIAIAWGPIVGYFAQHAAGGAPIQVVAFEPRADGVRYGFSIAMGVRYGQTALRDQLNELIAANQSEIDAILDDYGVPRAAPASADKPQ